MNTNQPNPIEEQFSTYARNFFENDVLRHTQELSEITGLAELNPSSVDSLQPRIERSIDTIEKACRELERDLSESEIESVKRMYRARIEPWYSQSFLMERATKKPSGYPGDYRTIEAVYNNRPLSEGLGRLLDNNFLNARLAVAIRKRKDAMKDLMLKQLQIKPDSRIMNIASGSCREWVELLPDVDSHRATLTCIDYDQDSLDYSAQRLREVGCIQTKFLNENVLKLALRKDNVQRFGQQDVVYSIGLYDYLPDKILRRLISAQEELLVPGGKMVVAFKDKERYDKTRYDWTCDWRFEQRNPTQIKSLLISSGINLQDVNEFYEPSNTIIFYEINKPK